MLNEPNDCSTADEVDHGGVDVVPTEEGEEKQPEEVDEEVAGLEYLQYIGTIEDDDDDSGAPVSLIEQVPSIETSTTIPTDSVNPALANILQDRLHLSPSTAQALNSTLGVTEPVHLIQVRQVDWDAFFIQHGLSAVTKSHVLGFVQWLDEQLMKQLQQVDVENGPVDVDLSRFTVSVRDAVAADLARKSRVDSLINTTFNGTMHTSGASHHISTKPPSAEHNPPLSATTTGTTPSHRAVRKKTQHPRPVMTATDVSCSQDDDGGGGSSLTRRSMILMGLIVLAVAAVVSGVILLVRDA